MSARVLVTGSRGFLGAYLVRELASRGVTTLELPASLRLPSPELPGLVRALRPTLVLHAAGPASVARSLAEPHRDFEGTALATECLLEALRTEAPGCRFVLLSSAAVYGNPRSLPIREDAAVAPISPYGFAKHHAELLVEQYARLHGVPGCSARIFSAYGAGLARQVIYELVRRTLETSVASLDGTGDETRDFVHARDVARALLRLGEAAPCEGERYNVASGREVSLRELASLVGELCGARETRFSGRVRPGDPTAWRADVSALARLGFSAEVELRDGVAEVRDFVRAARPAGGAP